MLFIVRRFICEFVGANLVFALIARAIAKAFDIANIFRANTRFAPTTSTDTNYLLLLKTIIFQILNIKKPLLFFKRGFFFITHLVTVRTLEPLFYALFEIGSTS